MSKRIVIVGGVAAGASAAAKARRTSEDVEIVMLEAGPYISFANCGLPYYVGGEIADREKLLVAKAEPFAKRFNVDVRVNTRAVAIDPGRSIVMIQTAGGSTDHVPYDRLMLATGATAVRPDVPGADRNNIFACHAVPDVDAITVHIDQTGAKTALIKGGGYIGLEVAEQLVRRGLKVTLIQRPGQVMRSMDSEMAWPLEKALIDEGAEVILSDVVVEIIDDRRQSVALTQCGRRIPFDLAVFGIGVRPNVELAGAIGLTLGETGAIAVDRFGRTSNPVIYAAGDNSETHHLVLDRPVNIPLAGPANKAGRAAGANMALDLMGAPDDDPRRLSLKGVLGTAIVRVGKAVGGGTGLTETVAAREGVNVAVTYMPGPSHAGYYPGAEPMVMKVLFDPATGRLLGGQAVGGEGVDKRIDVLAVAITAGMTVDDLEQLDLAYAPPFGSAKDVTILAGFAGANTRRGLMPAITPAKLLDELAGDAPPVVVDVRTAKEHAAGHLDGGLHIPVDDLRERLGELPKGKPLAVHCAGGYRSYLAQRILMNRGFDNVRNVLGGWTMIQRTRAARDNAKD